MSLSVLLILLITVLQKELGQKHRHLQQHQTKLDEMLRQLSEASYQQVWSRWAALMPWHLPWADSSTPLTGGFGTGAGAQRGPVSSLHEERS